MKFAFYTNIISPHQLPLAREIIARLGAATYRYVYLFDVGRERSSLGWGGDRPNWCVSATSSEGREWLENADFMLCGYRDVGIMERRAAKGLRTAYTSERWFKPWRDSASLASRLFLDGVSVCSPYQDRKSFLFADGHLGGAGYGTARGTVLG